MALNNDIIARLAVYQKQLESDHAKGVYWTYQHQGYKKTFGEAVSSGNRTLNCVILANWALRDLGIVDNGLLNHKSGGIFSYGSAATRQSIGEKFNILQMGDTQKNLAKAGKLVSGDILIHDGHMAVFDSYRNGTVYCYDAGRGNCDSGNVGARFKRFYGPSPYTNMRVTYLARAKDSATSNPVYNDGNVDYTGQPDGTTTQSSVPQVPRQIIITKRYEYYTGKYNGNVIAFTPEYQGMCVSDASVKASAAVDTVKNEMLWCSGKSSYDQVRAPGQIMGLSSSSYKNLESKSLSMWALYATMKYGATLEIMGDASVKVGTYCAVMVYTKYGFPHHTSGIYYIKEAVDSISGGVFTTTLTLRRVGNSLENVEAYVEGSEQEQTINFNNNQNNNTYAGTTYPTTGGDTSGGSGVAPNANVEKAVQWALAIANDNTHGYQWGGHGPVDYDCSGFVCEAFKQAGFNHGASYTGDMIDGFTKVGFKWIPGNPNVNNLQRGDILLNTGSHVELYVGGNQKVGAHSNYDGKSGDSSGTEISVGSYSGPWEGILRYVG